MKTPRTTLKHFPETGSYDRDTINAILDEGLVCYIAFTINGKANVIPSNYGRKGNKLYFHGSRASRALKALTQGEDICVNVTLVDGLILARSAFHHDMEYRSVILYGKATEVTDEKEKLEALQALVEQVVPGRWNDARKPSEGELKAVYVLSIPIEEASAKINAGPPSDRKEDYELGCWAGVIPLALEAKTPIDDPKLTKGIQAPDYVTHYRR